MTKTGTKTKTIKKVLKPKTELDETNKKVVTQKVIVHRELKYKYPKDCKEVLKRKSFRQKVRNAIRKMEREIAKLKGEDRRVLKEKLDVYMQANLM